jgi:hypothetical protein
MKLFLLKRLQGLYFYYSSGATAGVQYVKTISVFLLLLFLHYLELFFLLSSLFDLKIDLFPMPENAGKGLRGIFILIYFAPVYFILTILFPESVLNSPNVQQDQLVKYKNQFFIYALLLLVIILVTIWPKLRVR